MTKASTHTSRLDPVGWAYQGPGCDDTGWDSCLHLASESCPPIESAGQHLWIGKRHAPSSCAALSSLVQITILNVMIR
ncbi:hypothetical protein PGTUg99_028477 [Puccinia graminis f. sp. tritici]|uniref:Uncharacterized protein n=1 Tax=Puccinia graminis f. sp. tritici TaxID=56615 RepID=A0A5B0LVN6_PUCGR|nr:hypothetical protein PGTUg99_028477 [Puccinia graminis f. sp. tritici]